MTAYGQYTQVEILSQPEAWTTALGDLNRQLDDLRRQVAAQQYAQVIFTGCGSTYYLSIAAASLFRELTGMPSRGLPASELWLEPQSYFRPKEKVLLVAVSRSGETSETLRACQVFRDMNFGDILTFSCYPGCSLVRLGDTNILLPSGQEDSVAQTRAFSTLYLGTMVLAASWAEKPELIAELTRLPDVCRRLLQDYAPLARQIGTDADLERFYFLGSGSRYGLACELSLKMKEMSLSHSEPFHFLEFRHGPKSMATPGALVIGLLSEPRYAQESQVLSEMRLQGARTLTFGEAGADVLFASGVSPVVRNLLYLPVGQLVAYEHAMSRGLNPDRPENLTVFVELK